jgi:hypothetical protein
MRDPIPRHSKPMIIVSLVLCVLCLMSVACSQGSNIKFLDSLEDLLRSQSDLLTSFEYLLHRTPTNINEKTDFLNSFEDLLRRQANLLIQFEDFLKVDWEEMSIEEQEKFLESFGDLIKRESVLVSSFEALCHENWSTFSPEITVKFLASFEDLLRRMANLLKSYEELFKMKHGGIFIEMSADKVAVQKGEVVTYSYTVKNVYKSKKLTDVILVDDKLGTIADGISLGPGESRSFARSIELAESTCNQAKAMGKDPEGKLISGESGVTCVLVKNGGLSEPQQYGQYCEASKVVGNGIIDVTTSIVDKNIALDYYKNMAGDGDIEIDSEHLLSEKASKLKRLVDNRTVPLNFYETMNMEYSGKTPLTGDKRLSSRGFYGGIGADIFEIFSATQIDKKQKSFFASTDPTTNIENLSQSRMLIEETPVHLVGIDTENSFNGTWGTESRWYQLLKKDIQDSQFFTGTFETEKTIKFHEKPVTARTNNQCEGLDC